MQPMYYKAVASKMRFASSAPNQNKGGVFTSRLNSSRIKRLTPTPQVLIAAPSTSSYTTVAMASVTERAQPSFA
jgi:hypothetical protein